jgi:hypothetical protein
MASNLNLEAIANVLEKTAAYIDEQEAHQISQTQKVASDEVSHLTAQYQKITGEELPEDVRSKLASDAAVRATIQKIVDTSAPVDSLGGAAKGTKTAGAEDDESMSYSARTEARKKAAFATFAANVTNNR